MADLPRCICTIIVSGLEHSRFSCVENEFKNTDDPFIQRSSPDHENSRKSDASGRPYDPYLCRRREIPRRSQCDPDWEYFRSSGNIEAFRRPVPECFCGADYGRKAKKIKKSINLNLKSVFLMLNYRLKSRKKFFLKKIIRKDIYEY